MRTPEGHSLSIERGPCHAAEARMNAASAAVGTIDVIAIGVEALGYYVSVCARFRWASLFRSVAGEACEECDDVLL